MAPLKPRAITQRRGIGGVVFLIQDQRLLTRRLRSDAPSIVPVLSGRKIVCSPSSETIVEASEAIVIGTATITTLYGQ